MHTAFLDAQLVAYLSLREALGFQMRAEKILVPEFVTFVQAQRLTGPLHAQLALEWACSGPGGAARRLSMARRFLAYLQASAPDTEVAALALLPSPQRPKPYLFMPEQLIALFEAAQASRPRGSLRPRTLSTLIGLPASTGLRVGMAFRLRVGELQLDREPPQLHILETKFHKSRLVPLHPSTAEHLHHYRKRRARLYYAALSDTFFVSEQGQPLGHPALHYWFARLYRRLGMQPTDDGRGPCLMLFRHTFAVTCTRRWYAQGQDGHALLPHLSVYPGYG
jgi:integrase/recombinase XerD